jgi:hypothetical protein
VRGHLLTTRGKRLEDVGIPDFIDIVYAFAINTAPNEARTGMLSYMFDFKPEGEEAAEDMTFDGFKSASLSMLDELDDLHSTMAG